MLGKLLNFQSSTAFKLLLILVLAALLRTLMLKDSFTDENEAYNLSDVWGYRQALDKLPLLFQGRKQEFFKHLRTTNEKSELNLPLVPAEFTSLPARPGYPLLTLAASYLVGLDELTGKYLNAVLAIISIVVVFAFGRKLFSTNAGLLGAFLLALSLYHIAFSRSILSHILASLCILVSFYFHHSSLVSNRKLPLLFSGCFFGYAIATHLITVSFLPALVFFELYKLIKDRRVTAFLTRSIVFGAGVVIPLFGFQAISLMVAANLETERTFLKGLLGYLFYNVGSPGQYYSYTQPLNFFIYFLDSESVVSFVVIFWSVAILLRNKEYFSSLFAKLRKLQYAPEENYLEIVILAYLVVWLYGSVTNANLYPPRAFIYCVPFFAAWTGKLYLEIGEKYDKKVLAILVILFSLIQTSRSWKILALDTGYKEAARFIGKQSENTGVACISSRSIYRYYLGEIKIGRPARADDLYRFYKEEGIRYFTAEWHALWFYNTRNSFYEFERNYRPVKVIDNTKLGYFPYMAQAYCYPRDYLKMKKLAPKIQTIRIYDLKEIFSGSQDP